MRATLGVLEADPVVIPGIRYANDDDLLLAHQVVGAGPRDLVYLQFETPPVIRSEA